MKNFKRILALVMVFCTVAAWMIPGVSAEAPANLEVNFAEDFALAGLTATGWLSSNATNYGKVNGVYETTSWKLYTDPTVGQTNSGSPVNTAYPSEAYTATHFGLRVDAAGEKYSALQFKAPGTGDYELSITIAKKRNYQAPSLKAYIIEIPADDPANDTDGYTRYNLPCNDTTRVLSCDPSAIVNGTVTGDVTVSLVEGKEYILAFGITRSEADTTMKYAHLSGFSLTYVQKYDYSVTYYANDGTDATAADNENASQVTDLEKTITLDTPFSRDGYDFKGWATAADGEVVYKAGDTITLYPEVATADLYAVWEEAWDPANNQPLNIVFKDVSGVAGVTANTFWSAGYPAKTEAVYAQTGWTATTIYNTYPPRYFATGGMQFYPNAANATKYAASKFVAPGTGDYRLSLTPCVVSGSDPRADIGGAYIIPYSDTFTKNSFVDYTTVDNAVVLNAEQLKAGKNVSAENTVALEAGEEYFLVFFVKSDVATDKADFSGFSLTEVKPEASIGSTNYATVEQAIAEAVSGNTIKLNIDADIDELNPAAGVVVDLNGKTLTVAGAAVATVADSGDGTGLLAAAKTAVVTAANGQVALWDNTTDAEGYRVFNYTFSNYGDGIYEGANAAVTAVNKTYKMADGEANGTKVQTNMSTYFDAYAQKGWRFEATNAAYNLFKNQWHWGTDYGYAMNSSGTPTTAFRFQAPGTGEMTFTLNYDTHTRGTSDADIYIIPATAIDNAISDAHSVTAAAAGEVIADAINANSTSSGSWDEANATAKSYMNTIITAITAAIANENPVIDGMSFNNAEGTKETVAGKYDFGDEPATEYLLVIKANASVAGYGSSYIWDFSFNRAEKEASMAQSIWSVLNFTNDNAYALIASGENALSVGFDMAWNGIGKTFQFSDDQVLAWAEQELADDQTYGFYVRIEGFEEVGAGTLTGKPYISFGGDNIYANEVSYTYSAE